MKLRKSAQKRFVIFCRARTGSYLLVDLLNQFSDINCFGEVFKPGKVELPPWASSKMSISVEDRDKHPITFVNSLYALTPRKVTGMKVFVTHNEIARHYLAETKGIKKVILTRAPLDSYLSLKKAQLTQEWIRRSKGDGAEQEAYEDVKVRFEPVQFERYLKESKEFEDWCEDIETFGNQTFRRISYDQVVAIEPVRELAAYLGSVDADTVPKPKLEKQIKQTTEQLVQNYDEMMTCLRQMGLAA